MPLKKHRIKKVHFFVEDVAKELDLPKSTVRYWTKLIKLPLKKQNKAYLYLRKDVLSLLRIKRLKQQGYRLGYIVENKLYLKSPNSAPKTD